MRKSALLFSAAMASLATPAFAQSQTAPAKPADSAGADMQEIIVTAQKRSESLQKVPLAVSAFDASALQQRAAASLSDIQTLVPSVNIQQRFGSGVVTIRGVGFDVINAGAESSVALHQDGIYMSRPASALAGLFDVQRVEVARGPQGTLYGRNATGGAINIVTNKPTDTWTGDVRGSYGNYNETSLEGGVGGPLAGDVLSFRVAGRIQRRDGWTHNLFNNTDVEDLHTDAGRLQLLFKPSDRFSLLLAGDIFREDDAAFVFHYGGPAGDTPCGPNCGVSKGGTAPLNSRDINQDIPPDNHRDYKGITATAKLEATDSLTFTSITGYRKNHSFYNVDLDATSAYLMNITRLEDSKQFSQELQASVETDRVKALAGAYYFYENVYGEGAATFNQALVPFSVFCQCGTLKTYAYAAFGQLTYQLTDALSVTVGARYSNEKKHIIGETLMLRPTPDKVRTPALGDRLSFNAFTPKFGLEYTFGQGKLAYLNIQRGFKSGSFALGTVTPGFRPEFVWSYEAGIKATWLDGMLRTNLAAFHYDYSDLQIGFVQGLTPVIQNAASAKVDGLEFEVTAKPVKALRLEAIGSFLNARFSQYVTPDNARPQLGPLNLAGNHPSQAPTFSATFAATATAPVAGGSLDVRGEVFVSSRVYFSPYNVPKNSQAPYQLVNAFVTWKRGPYSIGLYGRNLLDKFYLTGGSVTSPIIGTTLNLTDGAPRTYGVTVGYSF